MSVFRLGIRVVPAFAAAIGLCACGARGSQPVAAAPPQEVGVTIAAPANLNQRLELEAELRPYQEIDVYAKEAGYVNPIYVDVGDHVKQGQTLALLEIPELGDQLDQAKANTAASQNDVTHAQQELARAESAAKVAHAYYARLANVIKTQPNLVAAQDVENAQGADLEAAAQVAADQSALAAAQARVTASQGAQAQASTLLSYAKITAPFAGVITARYADNGALLQAGISSHLQAEPLVKLSQNDRLRLVIPVPEDQVAEIHIGEPVDVRVPALNRTFPGTVSRFADQLDSATRTMHTEVDVPNPNLSLVPGMYAFADLVTAHATGALAVPVQAVTRDSNGAAAVWRVDANNTVEAMPVTTGLETPAMVQIVSGIANGDRVVVGGQGALRPGEVVSPRPVTLAANPAGSGH